MLVWSNLIHNTKTRGRAPTAISQVSPAATSLATMRDSFCSIPLTALHVEPWNDIQTPSWMGGMASFK